MYERSYGDKYKETKDIYDTSVLAKLMRADIKAAVKSGELSANATYSVRTRKFAGGAAIDIEIRDLDGAWVPEDESKCAHFHRCENLGTLKYHDLQCPGAEHLSDEAKKARELVKSIHDSYNYDGSEVMVDYFDVRFYGRVVVESVWSATWRTKEKAKKDARREAA